MSSNTPPPYIGITGIYTVDDKHQSVSKAQYDGSAKPGQIVIDTTDYSLWVGNANGNLNAVGGGGGGAPAGANTEIQFNDNGAFGADANLVYDNTSQTLTVTGTVATDTSLAGNSFTQFTSIATTYVEVAEVVTANQIDITKGNFFAVGVTGPITLDVINSVIGPGSFVASFVLEITDGGTNVTWWPNIAWAGGTPPTLTTIGTDVLAFYSVGGTNWRGFVLGLDMKV